MCSLDLGTEYFGGVPDAQAWKTNGVAPCLLGSFKLSVKDTNVLLPEMDCLFGIKKKNVLLSLPPSPRWFVWGRVPSGGLPSKKRAQNKNIGDWRGAQKITFPHTSKQLAKFYGQISAKRRGRFFGGFEGHPGLPDPWPRGGRSDPSGAPSCTKPMFTPWGRGLGWRLGRSSTLGTQRGTQGCMAVFLCDRWCLFRDFFWGIPPKLSRCFCAPACLPP